MRTAAILGLTLCCAIEPSLDSRPTELAPRAEAPADKAPSPSRSPQDEPPPIETTPPLTRPPPDGATSPPELPPFRVRPLTSKEREEMTGVTWRKQCPVGLEDLRAIDLHHLDMQGARQAGTLIVHHDVAHDVAGVFQALLQAGFPLTSVRPMRHFGGDDNASMAADNTSGFNCRPVAGTPRWSEHAYGRAIDVNPLRNPYVRGSNVQPPEGKGYLERDPAVPGLITEGDAADTAFSAIGWRWGGRWRSSKDFQHFSKSGR